MDREREKRKREGGGIERGGIKGKGRWEGRGEHGEDARIAWNGQGDPLPGPLKIRSRFLQDLFQLRSPFCSRFVQDPLNNGSRA